MTKELRASLPQDLYGHYDSRQVRTFGQGYFAMVKSRSALASELFTLRSTLPLWRKQSCGEPEFFDFLDKRINRLLSQTGSSEDRGYVLTHVNQMLATHGWDRQYS